MKTKKTKKNVRSTEPKSPTGYVALANAYKVIVDHLRGNTRNAELLANFEGTEDRAVRALIETCRPDTEIVEKLKSIVSVKFPVSRKKGKKEKGRPAGAITQGPIAIHSCCPHHLFPVKYDAYVSYIPKNGNVLGLSKLARIGKLLGRRPVLQEQLASDIADTLYLKDGDGDFPSVESAGSAVTLVGSHGCMSCRGVQEDALTHVTELRGDFWEPEMEQKFQNSISDIKTSKLIR